MNYILLLVISFLVNKFGTRITIQLAKKQQLFEPTNARKIHKEQISALGGISIFCSLWSIVFITIPFSTECWALFLATIILFSIGLWDDLKNIGVKKRLFSQLIAANLAYFIGFHFGFTNEFLDYIFSIGFLILMINGTNFVDGINGLAGSVGLLSFISFAYLFHQIDLPNLFVFSLIYGGVLLGFLVYNFGEKAAIFMGDNGSTVMGFITATFALKAIEMTPSIEISSIQSLIVITLVTLPILDLFAVVLIRLCKGHSPFKADRIHLHHLLTNTGKSHPESCLFILGWLLSLLIVFYYQLITTLSFGLPLIIGSYLLIRLYFSPFKVPLISVLKWDKPAPPPSPTPELNFE